VRTLLTLVLYLKAWRNLAEMTQLEVVYRYANTPTEAAMRAIDNMREVYGIRGLRFNEKEQTVRVEYDASRLKEPTVAGLLRKAGLDIGRKLVLA
jgi:hypothetical protein